MTKTTLTATACATLLCAGMALATPTPQQTCDSARLTAWKTYQSCVEGVIAKDAREFVFSTFAPLATCRHAYFKKWAGFQAKRFSGSTCIGGRFTDNGDQTVTDNLSTLVWEKKDSLGGVHDVNNVYSWGTPDTENGTAFSDFLLTLNADSFAGANGWRLPTLAELQTIVLDFACMGTDFGPNCSCPSSPCVDPALDSSNTHPDFYWSATSYLPESIAAWGVTFNVGGVIFMTKPSSEWGRSVRGGL